ncbi:MAG: hypothetical protein JXR76_12645 [Deltaproteobacteria bacterium]|nr:hypothetical protein [Deltaproteobacteria bacterium]
MYCITPLRNITWLRESDDSSAHRCGICSNRPKQSIAKNSDGAVMVMALFMGIFLCALLYHLVGVGEAATEAIMAQDATDSFTFTAAAAKARGMNTIALINEIMALILAVLVALRLVEFVLLIAIAIVSATCWPAPPTCGTVGLLAGIQAEVATIADEAEEIIMPILTAFTAVATVVNKATPFVAEGEAIYISKTESKPVSDYGFVWPVADELPTEQGEFNLLCGKAGKKVFEVSKYCIPGKVGDRALGLLEKLVGEMANTFSDYFCGDGGAPSKDRTEPVAYPGYSDRETSDGDLKCDTVDAQPAGAQNACWSSDDEYDENCDNKDPEPIYGHAGCEPGNQTCIDCEHKACETCLPLLNNVAFKKALWQVKTEELEVHGDLNSQSAMWKSIEEPFSTFEWIDRNPCVKNHYIGMLSASQMEALEIKEYRKDCGGDFICVVEQHEFGGWFNVPDSKRKEPRTRVVRRTYEKMYACIVNEKIPLKTPEKFKSIDVDGQCGGSCSNSFSDVSPASSGNNSSPSSDTSPRPRILKKKAVPDDFRLWGVGIAKKKAQSRENEIGKFYNKKAQGKSDKRVTAAAAEFRTESKRANKELDDMRMWQLKWYGRLIRFRLPKENIFGESSGAENSTTADDVSNNMGDIQSQLEKLSVH